MHDIKNIPFKKIMLHWNQPSKTTLVGSIEVKHVVQFCRHETKKNQWSHLLIADVFISFVVGFIAKAALVVATTVAVVVAKIIEAQLRIILLRHWNSSVSFNYVAVIECRLDSIQLSVGNQNNMLMSHRCSLWYEISCCDDHLIDWKDREDCYVVI